MQTTHTSSTSPPRRGRDESGMAMVVALMVIAVAALLAVLAASLAFHGQSTSQVDRKRTQAIAAAEAGLDNALLRVTSTTLPCTSTTPANLQTQPTTSSYTVTYTYYDSYPPTGPALTSCPPALGVAKAVEITAKGTTNAKVFGDRSMQALAKLTAVPGTAFNKAIYASGTLTISNNTLVNGQVGDDGDIYTNQAFTCANSLTVHGSVSTQAGATLSNTCTIANDLYAKNDVVGSGNGSIGHDVKSSQGNITIDNPRTVGHDAIVGVGKTITGTGTVVGSKITGQTGLLDPPVEPFPAINWSPSASDWNDPARNLNFTIVLTNNTCSGANNVYTTIAGLSNAANDTIVVTDCALAWSGNTSISFNKNVAIFARGGFSTANNFTMQSTVAGTKRNLYWIVPANWATAPCASPGITTGNLSKFIDLQVLFYSPCNISAANQQASSGQIYGGSNVAIQNNFTLSFVPLPLTANANSVAPPTSYNVDLAYKREAKNNQ